MKTSGLGPRLAASGPPAPSTHDAPRPRASVNRSIDGVDQARSTGSARQPSTDASDPDAARIVQNARNALQPRLPLQLRLRGADDWPTTVTGTIERRRDKGTNAIVSTFVVDKDGSLATSSLTRLTLTAQEAQGLANNARVTLNRDDGHGWYVAKPLPGDGAFMGSLVGRVESRADGLWVIPSSELSALPALPLREADGVSVGDFMVAELRTSADGGSHVVPSDEPKWRKLDPELADIMSIVVDEAGVDVTIPEIVRAEATAALAAKPLTVEALTAAGYRDLTAMAFFTTDNPDSPGGKVSHDYDQGVALEERADGGFTFYRGIAHPEYFFDFFPEGERDATTRRAMSRMLTAYFKGGDAPIYDRRFSEGAMSLAADGVRPSFVVKLELDAHGRIEVDDSGQPRVEVMKAAVKVRHNGNYWDSNHYIEGGDGDTMPPDYRAFWDAAKRLGDAAGVKPRAGEELVSKAIESYFSQLANSVIPIELERLLRENGLYEEDGAKYISRVQPPPEPEQLDAFFGLIASLDLQVPPAPPLTELARTVSPNDDRWPAVTAALGLDDAPPSKIYEALSTLASAPNDPRFDAVRDALWTPREQARALIDEQEFDPRLQGTIAYNLIRRLPRARVSASDSGHYDVGRLFYGWLTAPMRRTVDVINQALWSALMAKDIPRAKRILAQMPALAAQHERMQKRMDQITREVGLRETAIALQPYVKQGLLDGTVRYIGLEGVEVTLDRPQVQVVIPLKWLAQRFGGQTPRPSRDGDALLVDRHVIVQTAQETRVRIDRADPKQRKIYVDIMLDEEPR